MQFVTQNNTSKRVNAVEKKKLSIQKLRRELNDEQEQNIQLKQKCQ